jgi:hypothetical protein
MIKSLQPKPAYDPESNEQATTQFWILSHAYFRGSGALTVGVLITAIKNLGQFSISPRLADRAATLMDRVVMGGHRKKGHTLCEVVTLRALIRTAPPIRPQTDTFTEIERVAQ